jgi:hypothetical protein
LLRRNKFLAFYHVHPDNVAFSRRQACAIVNTHAEAARPRAPPPGGADKKEKVGDGSS